MIRNYFAILFEDGRHERSLFFLLSLTDEGILRQAGFTDIGIGNRNYKKSGFGETA